MHTTNTMPKHVMSIDRFRTHNDKINVSNIPKQTISIDYYIFNLGSITSEKTTTRNYYCLLANPKCHSCTWLMRDFYSKQTHSESISDDSALNVHFERHFLCSVNRPQTNLVLCSCVENCVECIQVMVGMINLIRMHR